ncbi:hypothetical protein AGR8A_Lc40278 [Agrobacterium fabrum str. J-07]|nr:hypothetical protein AGR8A_Lc40278 [Agrobacterium fabrum str. J-07]
MRGCHGCDGAVLALRYDARKAGADVTRTGAARHSACRAAAATASTGAHSDAGPALGSAALCGPARAATPGRCAIAARFGSSAAGRCKTGSSSGLVA